ncbi:MAG: sigma-70 family RNA polymerase sigma factor [Pirellulales bacterium]|nr:sigma-70 family RNA polymerase sigma factor [Pirellulales bacterium]
MADLVIVLDCQNGSAEAMEKLVARWQKRLWQHAYHLTGNAEAAWEVTQESWLGIVRGLPRLTDPEKFKPWAFRIVTNKSNDWIRRKLRFPQSGQTDCDPVPAADTRGEREQSSDLRHVLRKLKPQSQMILSLYYFEQFSVHQVAEVLGIAVGTVKSRLHTARNEFRKLWEADRSDSPSSRSVPEDL